METILESRLSASFAELSNFTTGKKKWSLNFVLLPDLLLYILFLLHQGNNFLFSVLVQLIIPLMIQLI